MAQLTAQQQQLLDANIIPVDLPADLFHLAEPILVAQAQAQAIARVLAYQKELMTKLGGNYNAEERDSWLIQKPAALALIAGTASQMQTQLLADAASVETGETALELAHKIVHNDQMYHNMVGKAVGLRRRTVTLIEQAQTVADVEQVLVQSRQLVDQAVEEFMTQWGQ